MSKLLEERITILEVEAKETQKDLLQAYKDIKDHMDKEELDREVWLSKLGNINSEVNEINITLTHWKGFVGGAVFIVTAMFAAILAVYKYLV